MIGRERNRLTLITIQGTRTYIPSAPLDIDDIDEKTGERFTVPCKRFSVPSLPLGRVDNIERYLENIYEDSAA